MSDRVTVDVYFDFACPYVHSAASWLREVNRQLGDNRNRGDMEVLPARAGERAAGRRHADLGSAARPTQPWSG